MLEVSLEAYNSQQVWNWRISGSELFTDTEMLERLVGMLFPRCLACVRSGDGNFAV